MEKRNLYKPGVKKGGVQKASVPEEPPPPEFKEDEVFTKKEKTLPSEPPVPQEPEVEHLIDIDEAQLPPEVAKVVESADIPLEKPKKQRKKRELTPAMRENLKRMNEKSAEVRRKKKEERLAREAEAKAELEAKIREKYPNHPRPEPEKTAIDSMQQQPPPPAAPIRQVSGIRDTASGVDDYDRLIQGVVGALRQDKYYSQIEQDIRQDERRRAERDYQAKLKEYEEKQHKQHQRDIGFSILSGSGRRAKGHNSTFLRTSALQSKYRK